MVPKIITLIAAGSLFCVGCLEAETTSQPDAGSLLLQQRPRPAQVQELLKPDSQPGQVEVLPKPDAAKPQPPVKDDGIRVTVKAFKFVGFEGVASEGELQSLVAGSLGKSLSFGDLEAIAQKITSYLKRHGWLLADVYIPAQDVTSGVIVIKISPGKGVGAPSIKRDTSVRISEKPLRRIAEHSYQSGFPLNERDIERSVLLMNDLPGITAKSSLSPGIESGTSRLEYFVKEESLLSGLFWVDNQGNRYTGSWEENANLLVNDPFRQGDQFSFTIKRSEGLVQGDIGYRFPLFVYPGLTGTLNFTGMHYKLLEELAALHYGGNSYIIDAGLSYPIVRSRKSNLTTSVNYDHKKLIDNVASKDIRDRAINRVTFSVRGDYQDALLLGGYTSWNIGVTTGKLHESIKDISLTKTEGGYTRFNLMLSRLQSLTESVSFDLSLTSQIAMNNLDSSEKFFLGGPNSVRAYPLGEAPGDHGGLINADIRYRIPAPAKLGALQLSMFYDAGHVTLNKERYPQDVVTATNRNDYWLQGAGLGIRDDISKQFVVQGSWAHVIGDNPGRNATNGTNSDGMKDKSRFWLQGLMYF